MGGWGAWESFSRRWIKGRAFQPQGGAMSHDLVKFSNFPLPWVWTPQWRARRRSTPLPPSKVRREPAYPCGTRSVRVVYLPSCVMRCWLPTFFDRMSRESGSLWCVPRKQRSFVSATRYSSAAAAVLGSGAR